MELYTNLLFTKNWNFTSIFTGIIQGIIQTNTLYITFYDKELTFTNFFKLSNISSNTLI